MPQTINELNFFAWKDLVKLTDTGTVVTPEEPFELFSHCSQYTGWASMLAVYGAISPSGFTAMQNASIDLGSAYIRRLLDFYVYPRVWEDTAVISLDPIGDFTFRTGSAEICNENSNADIVRFVRLVASYLISSAPYYQTIIDSLETNKANLMKAITTTSSGSDTADNHSVVKNNEMPQTEYASTDDHLSSLADTTDNATGTNSSTVNEERDSMINRLADIREKLDNTYERWASEFIQKFTVNIRKYI